MLVSTVETFCDEDFEKVCRTLKDKGFDITEAKPRVGVGSSQAVVEEALKEIVFVQYHHVVQFRF